MLENAKWITRTPWIKWDYPKDPAELPPSPYLARTFTLSGCPVRAQLTVAGLGQAAYYCNGMRIPDSFRPTQPSTPTATVICNVYDLTALLHTGRNRLGVILGNNGYNDTGISRWRSTTKMIARLDVTFADGKTQTVVSDTAWKTADSPILFSLRRCGEKRDARLEIPGWCDADFDDSAWDNAVICQGPGGAPRTTLCPPERILRRIEGREIAHGVFDFGENTSGVVHLTVRGKRDATLQVLYAERLTADGTHVDQNGMFGNAYRPMAHRDVYMLAGGGTEEFEPLFSYHGFRYAEVQGEWDTLTVTACVAHTDIHPASSFICDNDTVNAIHTACVRSILTNCHGALVDCPHREQNEWTGDGMLSAEAVCIGFDAYEMLYEWMLKFQDDQYPDGCLPCIIPMKDAVWEHNFANGPDWDSAIFHIPYYAYKYSGDRRIVDQMWENMLRSLQYFDSRTENGLLRCGVGDWAPAGETCDKEITDTAYYRLDALMMAEMATATGRNAAPFTALADKIKAAFREKYVRDGRLTDTHETTLAAAMYTGMLDAAETAAAAKQLADSIAAQDYCFTCGVHGLRMIFDALSQNGYAQTVFDTITNPRHPGYAHAATVRKLTTLPEWDNYGASLNHHFRSPVDSFFYTYLAGIRIHGFGYDHVEIAPQLLRGLHSVTATMHGIGVHYDDDTLTVDCPYPFTLVQNGKSVAYPAGKITVSRK